MPLVNRIANTFTNRITEIIFFLHIPKCGGVSIGQAIEEKYLSIDLRNDRGIIELNAPVSGQVIKTTEGINYPYGTNDDFPLLNFREKLLLYFMGQPSTKFISGHFLFSDQAYQEYGDKFMIVTVLRDPIQRWLSSYFFNRFKRDDHVQVYDDIEPYLDTHFGISQGYELIKFLGGANWEGDYISSIAINRAIENLKKFGIVGFLEDLDSFSRKFYDRFQVNLKIGKKNQNPAPKYNRKSTITTDLLEKITEICQPDIQVYEYALKNFNHIDYL